MLFIFNKLYYIELTYFMMKERKVFSKDGRCSVNYSDIQHVCICYSLYPLLQYLLLFDDETTMKHTCYFLGSGGIPQGVSDRLPAFYFDTKPCKRKKDGINRAVQKLWMRFSKDWKYPFLKKSKIFAQDFGYLSILIGCNEYALLAEASHHLTSVYEKGGRWFEDFIRKNNSLKGKMEALLYGRLATHIHGDNEQCASFYLTERNFAPVFGGKPVYIDTFIELWGDSDKRKRKWVQYVFGVSDEEIRILKNKPIWFFTQPLVHDHWYSEAAYVEIIEGVLKHYDRSKIVFKIHPRDDFNYDRYFPDIELYTKAVPMQLLVLSGVQFERAVTLCSTAVDIMPESVQIDWFGIPQKNLLIDGLKSSFPFNRPYNQMFLEK